MSVPYYTTTVLPGATLVLDSNGLPVYQGLADVRFTVSVVLMPVVRRPVHTRMHMCTGQLVEMGLNRLSCSIDCLNFVLAL